MWRGKAAAAGVVCLVGAGCASVQEQQLRQGADPQVRKEVEVELTGCLLSGTAPGTFVLADVANAERPTSR